jgi:hypothetical protein
MLPQLLNALFALSGYLALDAALLSAFRHFFAW